MGRRELGRYVQSIHFVLQKIQIQQIQIKITNKIVKNFTIDKKKRNLILILQNYYNRRII